MRSIFLGGSGTQQTVPGDHVGGDVQGQAHGLSAAWLLDDEICVQIRESRRAFLLDDSKVVEVSDDYRLGKDGFGLGQNGLLGVASGDMS